jgi:hypothetical protein
MVETFKNEIIGKGDNEGNLANQIKIKGNCSTVMLLSSYIALGHSLYKIQIKEQYGIDEDKSADKAHEILEKNGETWEDVEMEANKDVE